MKLYFVRHGESEANVLRVISNRDLPHALTEAGRAQAQALAQKLRDVPFTRIYASQVLRARQTAEIVSHQLGAPYEPTEALHEFDCGILEGRSDPDAHEAYRQLTAAWMEGREWDRGIEGGESLHDVRRRLGSFVERLVREHAATDTLLLVGHGATYRFGLPFVLRNVDFAFAVTHGLNYTQVVIAETRPEGLTCLAWGDTLFATE
jgi:probable phosphoglycerate mutase